MSLSSEKEEEASSAFLQTPLLNNCSHLDFNDQVERDIQTIVAELEHNPYASTDQPESTLSLTMPNHTLHTELNSTNYSSSRANEDEEIAASEHSEVPASHHSSVVHSLTHPHVPHVDSKMQVSKVSSLVTGGPGIAANAAFVTFKTIQAAQTAEQFLQNKTPHQMTVTPAPGVADVLWGNIGLKHKVKEGYRTTATILSTLIIFFWTIPTTFVVGLASVEGLSKTIPGFGDFVADNPWVVTVLEQLGPLIFVAMGSAVPSIFR